MEDVAVTFSGVGHGVSNEDGKYDLMVRDNATSALTFSAPGYQDVFMTAKPTVQGTEINVRMQRLLPDNRIIIML